MFCFFNGRADVVDRGRNAIKHPLQAICIQPACRLCCGVCFSFNLTHRRDMATLGWCWRVAVAVSSCTTCTCWSCTAIMSGVVCIRSARVTSTSSSPMPAAWSNGSSQPCLYSRINLTAWIAERSGGKRRGAHEGGLGSKEAKVLQDGGGALSPQPYEARQT